MVASASVLVIRRGWSSGRRGLTADGQKLFKSSSSLAVLVGRCTTQLCDPLTGGQAPGQGPACQQIPQYTLDELLWRLWRTDE